MLAHVPIDVFMQEYGIILKVFEHGQVWRNTIAAYYSITPSEAKELLTRLMFDGSGSPNTEWEPSKGNDLLPCLLELRYVIRKEANFERA